MQPQNSLLAQDIVTWHRICCITQRRPNMSLIILWNINHFNSLNFEAQKNFENF
jgi:hypothetical protein